MFESLSQQLGGAIRNLSGRGRITEANVRDSMSEVRASLLEADVHVDVVHGAAHGGPDFFQGAHFTRAMSFLARTIRV